MRMHPNTRGVSVVMCEVCGIYVDRVDGYTQMDHEQCGDFGGVYRNVCAEHRHEPFTAAEAARKNDKLGHLRYLGGDVCRYDHEARRACVACHEVPSLDGYCQCGAFSRPKYEAWS